MHLFLSKCANFALTSFACVSLFLVCSNVIWAGCVTSINPFPLYPVPGFEHSNQIYERNILKKVIKSCRVLQNRCQKLFQYLIRFLYPYSGVLYIKQNVPIMATCGSKDFGFYQPRPELRPEKVVTVTLGHPVVTCHPLGRHAPIPYSA